MNGYDLTRIWFDFAFESKEVKATHMALHSWLVEIANRTGWKEIIDLPTDYSMAGSKIGSYKTYRKCLNDIADWGFIELISGKNQYTVNRFSFKSATVKNTKALTKAVQNQIPKQYQSTAEANTKAVSDNINLKPQTSNLKPIIEAEPLTKISEFDLKDESKKEKSSGQKETSLHTRLRDAFCEVHREYAWDAINASNLNQLISKLRNSIKAKTGRDPTEEDIFKAGEHIFSHLPDWMKERNLTTIPDINSKYNRIIAELKNSQHNGKSYSSAKVADLINQRYGQQPG